MIEPAIWAENIPFNETRDYVKKVLSNATDYAALLGAPQAPSLKARLARRADRRRASCLSRAGAAIADAALPDAPAGAAPTDSMSRMSCCLGGTGFVGRALAAQAGRRARAAAACRSSCRRAAVAQAAHSSSLPTVELAQADVHDDAALARAAAPAATRSSTWSRSCTAATASSSGCTSQLPRTLAPACAAAGVRRVVHVSALGVSDEAPSQLSAQQGRPARRCCASAGLDLTLLRPVGDVRRRAIAS